MRSVRPELRSRPNRRKTVGSGRLENQPRRPGPVEAAPAVKVGPQKRREDAMPDQLPLMNTLKCTSSAPALQVTPSLLLTSLPPALQLLTVPSPLPCACSGAIGGASG